MGDWIEQERVEAYHKGAKLFFRSRSYSEWNPVFKTKSFYFDDSGIGVTVTWNNAKTSAKSRAKGPFKEKQKH